MHGSSHGSEHGFTWLSLIPGVDMELNHVYMTVIVMVIVLIGAFIARLQLNVAARRKDCGLIPDSKLTLRNLFEISSEKIYGLCESVMGKHLTEIHFPLIATLFIFIFIANFSGLLPGVLPPTDNLNTTFALGVFVFVFYNIAGLRASGLAYFKHFLGPVLWLSPLLLVIELASHLFRPVSLGLRLRGNIMGDHVVLGIFNNLTPYLVPLVFYGIGLFVSFVQALVFCLMTMVYISLSASTDHH